MSDWLCSFPSISAPLFVISHHHPYTYPPNLPSLFPSQQVDFDEFSDYFLHDSRLDEARQREQAEAEAEWKSLEKVRLQKEKAYEEAQRQRQLVIQSKYRLEEEMAIQVARREKEKREQEEEARRRREREEEEALELRKLEAFELTLEKIIGSACGESQASKKRCRAIYDAMDGADGRVVGAHRGVISVGDLMRAMQNDVKITVQLGLPRAFYEGQKGGNGTRNVTDAQIVAILKGMFTATMGGYGGFKNRLDGAGHLSRVQFCSYFGQRPTGQLTLPHVDDASLQRVLKSMEKDETTRKWRRASLVIQCAVRGRLARQKRASLVAVDILDATREMPGKPPDATPRPLPLLHPLSWGRTKGEHREALQVRESLYDELSESLTLLTLKYDIILTATWHLTTSHGHYYLIPPTFNLSVHYCTCTLAAGCV